MATIATKSSPQPDESAQKTELRNQEGGTISDRSARQIGQELTRLLHEVSVNLPSERPALPSLERAAAIIETSKLDDKRATGAPAPSSDDLRALAQAIGHVRAMKDAFAIRSEVDPLFVSGATCLDALERVGKLRTYRETIEFLRANELQLDVAERSHPKHASELGFFIRTKGLLPPEKIDAWERSVDRVFETFENRVLYLPEAERRVVRFALDKLRHFHVSMKTLDDVVAKHGDSAIEDDAPMRQLARASGALGKSDLDMAVPRFQGSPWARSGAYTALIFTLRAPHIREALDIIADKPMHRFTERLIERMVTDENPRVMHEMNRLARLLRTHAEPTGVSSIPAAEVPRTDPATTLRANLAEKLAFLREGHGERFEHILDDLSRKVGPKVAIERFNHLARCCRNRSEEGLTETLVSLDPKILTLPSERFSAYVENLRTRIAIVPPVPAERLLPNAIEESLRAAPRPVQGAPIEQRDARETEIINQLNTTGLDGEMALAILKHGFHHQATLFTGHRTINRQTVLSIAEAKVDGSRADLKDCLDSLVRRGAVVQDTKPGKLALNRLGDISEPALRAAVSYVERFWAEHRNA